MSSASDGHPNSTPFSLARVLMIVVPALIVVGAVYAMKSREFGQEAHQKEAKYREQMGIKSTAAPMRLDGRYSDADGDLVADTPQDPAKQVSPDKIIFAFIAGPDAETDKDNWQEFVAYLQKQTGKLVEMVTFKTTEEEIAALRDGKLHVAGFNTGAVPLAVNTAGFVPVCTRAGEDGKFSDAMQIIVAANSSIRDKHPEDLKGHIVAFTDRTSNSGYKAAVLLLKNVGLEPPDDYNFRFSTGHSESIKGIMDGNYEVGPVSREMLHRAIDRGDASTDKLRVIYESERFPPATLGYAYNLSPALAAKIKAAFMEFPWKGSGLENQFAGSGSTKFVPVSYKDDFEVIRRNNDAVQDPVDVASNEQNQAP